MKTCENCGGKHKGEYGSGRFCSIKCSRGFSTKHKRAEINAKISNKLAKPELQIICEVCKNPFSTKRRKRSCSKKCADLLQIGVSKKGNYMNNGGPRKNGGRSKGICYTNKFNEEMILNKEEIEVAKILDKSNLKWSRNWKGFEYINVTSKKSKFYPDFYIEELNLYVEYKGWITIDMEHKMKEAVKRNPEMDLIIVVGSDKRYLNKGISLSELEIKLRRVQSR